MKDIANADSDALVAKQVYLKRAERVIADIESSELRDYFEYCGQRRVVFGVEAEEKLTNYWIQLRKKDSLLPVTVRQLEALIRISESIARLQLKERVTVDDCDCAIALFESSTADVLSSDIGQELSRSTTAAIANAQTLLRQRMTLRKVVLESEVIREVAELGVPDSAVAQAIKMMIQNGEIERIRGRQIQRVK